MTNQPSLIPTLDPTEAPDGYYAVLKADAKPKDGSNICRACDWRPECQKLSGYITHFQKCNSYTTINMCDGSRCYRRDGCDVLFKRKDGK